MAIETRHGNRQYFYRKRRIGGRVVSEYVGGSEFDFMLQRLEQVERYRANHRRNLAEAERTELEKIDACLSELETEIKHLIEKVLTGKGFYKTKSREWRLKAK